jgi:hypothetical protein
MYYANNNWNRIRRNRYLVLCSAFAAVLACSDTAGPKAPKNTVTIPGADPINDPGGPVPSSQDAGADVATFQSGRELRVPVPETGRTYVRLNPPSIVAVTDPKASLEWDLAFEGYDVFTNGGVSGGGRAASFGPLAALGFVSDTAPQVPFLFIDKTGGAFVDFYEYEGAPTHALWSRYHVFGVKDGARLWKVQVLTYYGQRDGASISGLYRIRYAELTGATSGPTQEVQLDGTAGGAQAPVTAPSECIDFGTGARVMLTPDAARASNAWHLCFRRQTISVNGELGGPRGIGAIDLEADKTASETLGMLQMRTPESERSRFDAVTAAAFEGKVLRGDRVISGFGDGWVDSRSAGKRPAYATWLAVEASGNQKHLIAFSSFEVPTSKSPGTVVMFTKPVKE